VTLPLDENGERQLVTGYPGKAELIRLSTRPPQLETPFEVFDRGVITPNEYFFVRYHGAPFPVAIDVNAFRLRVRGLVGRSLSLSMADLKSGFQPIEVVAVNQCAGNSRGFSNPRVRGGQWGNGAMGNARWTGVALKDVLNSAGVKAGAVQVTFDGLDKPSEDGPDFVKALDIDHALDGEVMLAYAMNGEDLPLLNGYPLRLVVPGFFGTYWVKHVNAIRVIGTVFDQFWMNPAYRIPDNPCACVPPGTAPTSTVPINRLNVRSFITNLKDGDTVRAGSQVVVKGIAFDGRSGIRGVELSSDGGQTWWDTELGEDLGRYSFRPWLTAFTPTSPGLHQLKVRAISHAGEQQPMESRWNPSGYMRNVVETVSVTAV
jgi:DMSO/TMAO reductase YedYZ molybdopterin-dependent catalytic subunit